jgi:Fic family protein
VLHFEVQNGPISLMNEYLPLSNIRSFLKTHPWLTFRATFQREASPLLWMMLGECASKCDHIAGVPLRPALAAELYKIYLAKGVLATTAIEGNTLTEEEVRQHLDGKLQLPPSREYLAQEIDNVVAGCNSIHNDLALGKTPALTADRIVELNRAVLNKLTLEEGVKPGEIRRHNVTVGRYRGAPAEDCRYLLERLCEWLASKDFEARPGLEIPFAILKAVLAHIYLAWIHPFGDGNGRTARLVEFQILISSGVPAPSAHLLSNHYNQTRSEYYRQLDSASKSGGDVLPFVMYAVKGLVDQLRTQVSLIRGMQLEVTWRNYVHEMFRDKTGVTQNRRRHLALDLSQQPEPVPMAKIPEISPRLASAYAKRTRTTLLRDVNALIATGLLTKEESGYRAKKEVIAAFLPLRATPNH